MGVLKFLLPSNDLARRLPGFRKAYMTGLDRTPGRLERRVSQWLDGLFPRDQRKRTALRSLADRGAGHPDRGHRHPG